MIQEASLSEINKQHGNESSAVMDKLARIIECPVCLEAPTSTPIYRCDNGHLICKDCKKKVTHCPLCRTLYDDKRCLTSEKIVSEIHLEGMSHDSQPSADPDPPPNQLREEENNRSERTKKILVGVGVGVGAVAGVAAAPLVLSAAGFTAGGVAAGSIAATVQSVVYGGATCGVFSALQSAGAAGLGLVGNAVAGSVGAAMAAGTAKAADSVTKKSTKNE